MSGVRMNDFIEISLLCSETPPPGETPDLPLSGDPRNKVWGKTFHLAAYLYYKIV